MIRHSFSDGMYVRELAPKEPDGTLLYVHGLGESGLDFESVMSHPRLGRWRHLVPDMPGYGKSPWLEKPMVMALLADRLVTWLASRSAGPVVVLGHSMGGVVGLLCAEARPGQVRGFINVEGNVTLADCAFSGKVAAQSQEDFLAHGWERLLEDLYRDGAQDLALRSYYPSVRMCDPRAYHLNSQELVEVSRAGTLASRLAALDALQIYILGHPRGTGEESQSRLAEAGVKWRGIPSSGHWPFIDQLEVFVDEVAAFLSECSRRFLDG